MSSDMAIAARKSWENWVSSGDDENEDMDKVAYAGEFRLYNYALVYHDVSGKLISVYMEPSQVSDPWKVLDEKNKDEDKNEVEDEEEHTNLNIHQKPIISLTAGIDENNGSSVKVPTIPKFLISHRKKQNLVPYDALELFEFLKPKCSCHDMQSVTICPHAFWRVTLVKVWTEYLKFKASIKEWAFFEEINASTPNCLYLGTMTHDEVASLRKSIRIMFFDKPNLKKILNQVYKFFCQYLPKEIFWELEPGTPRYS
jgi:hypothetical protein